MTVYSFAFLPKRCGKCGRRFWLERCDYYYEEVGIEHYPLKLWACERCMKKWGLDKT